MNKQSILTPRTKIARGEIIMTLFKVLAAAAILSVTTGATAFARTPYEHIRHEQMVPRVNLDRNAGGPVCLHDYADDYTDCSYSSHSQCAATASGGLGECSMN
jgi:hypothetical protein